MEISIEKIKNVCDFYAITHKLKNTLRSGWKVWDIDAERFESIAEHIYGTQMLALAINAEFNLGLDIARVALMLAVHELGEVVIGDLPTVGRKISREEKHRLEMEAVEKILGGLNNSDAILQAYIEFEEMKTPEAKFAYFMDKLDCPFQCKFYEEKGHNDLFKTRTGDFKQLCDKTISEGKTRLFDMWVEYDKEHFFAGQDFYRTILDYIADNDIYLKDE